MADLHEHLQHHRAEAFQPSELNYVILMLYNFLWVALRDHCDTVSITPQGVAWSREGLAVGHFPHSDRQTMTHRTAMERILERDEIVRRHFLLTADTADEVIYRIVDGDQPLPNLAGATGNTPARADD